MGVRHVGVVVEKLWSVVRLVWVVVRPVWVVVRLVWVVQLELPVVWRCRMRRMGARLEGARALLVCGVACV